MAVLTALKSDWTPFTPTTFPVFRQFDKTPIKKMILEILDRKESSCIPRLTDRDLQYLTFEEAIERIYKSSHSLTPAFCELILTLPLQKQSALKTIRFFFEHLPGNFKTYTTYAAYINKVGDLNPDLARKAYLQSGALEFLRAEATNKEPTSKIEDSKENQVHRAYIKALMTKRGKISLEEPTPLQSAEVLHDKIVRCDLSNFNLQNFYIKTALRIGNLQRATNAFYGVAKVSDRNTYNRYILGALNNGNFEEAQRAFDLAIKSRGIDTPTVQAYIISNTDNNRFEETCRAYHEVNKIDMGSAVLTEIFMIMAVENSSSSIASQAYHTAKFLDSCSSKTKDPSPIPKTKNLGDIEDSADIFKSSLSVEKIRSHTHAIYLRLIPKMYKDQSWTIINEAKSAYASACLMDQVDEEVFNTYFKLLLDNNDPSVDRAFDIANTKKLANDATYTMYIQAMNKKLNYAKCAKAMICAINSK